jgi:hypothetical protein
VAEPTAAELQGLVMAQQKEIAAMRASTERAVKSAAINNALASKTLVHPASAGQIEQIIDEDVTVHKDANGQTTVTGPGFQPLGEYIESRLQSDMTHFVRGGQGTSTSAGQTGRPNGAVEPKNMGEAAMMDVIAMGGLTGDGRKDPRFAFGLRRQLK